MTSVREESESLRDYGRCRFQTAVESSPVQDRRGPGPLSDDTRRRRPVTVSGYPSCPVTSRPPTNGPTRDGSVLYRTTPLVLSSIRTRPRSESVSRFNHLRGTTEIHPSIQQALMQSNCEYRLVTSSTSVDRDAGGQQPRARQGTGFIKFVPMVTREDVTPTQEEREETPPPAPLPPLLDEPEKVKKTREEGMSEMGSYIDNKDDMGTQEATSEGRISDNVSVDENLEDKTKSSADRTVPGKVTRSGKVQEKVSTMQLRGSAKKKSPKQTVPAVVQRRVNGHNVSRVSFVSLGCSLVECVIRSPEQVRPPKVTSANQKKRASPKLPPPEVKSQPIPPSSPSSSKSAGSLSISTTSIIHHPRCWVDEVSISSDEPEVEMPLLDISETVAPGGLQSFPTNTSRVGSKALSLLPPAKQKSSIFQKVEDSQRPTVPNVDTRVEEQESEKPPPPPQVMEGEEKEEEEKEVVLTFPQFLCPSSERRSRQVATKEWLAKSPFSAAIKTVPLM
ncbi:hypothetical protein C0Q70_16500 [Pomacea canaliculata]|uniref:Uncharacterized protein n=1 Tax=Pomacea canaliculata TaxID=400727 RepID=A0A2T7NPY8_POMCA|nr:hypothetical protein C0Q70_16500 [Pomacea canaliculata]